MSQCVALSITRADRTRVAVTNNWVIGNHAPSIWSVAELLRGDCEQSDDGQMILHTVLHSLDCVPDPM